MGKSELLNQLVEFITGVEKAKAAVFKFEEENEITCKKIAGKRYHKDFINAEKVMIPQEDGTYRDIWGNEVFEGQRGYFKQEELIAATDEVGDSVIYYNNYGRAVWDELKGAIRHAVIVEGCEDIFIDPITRLVQGMSASEANQELERFSDEISKLAKELGFTYYCFCHLNKPESGKPHEFGGPVQSAQFAGSRAMMRNTYYMWGIERDKNPELPMKQRNTSWFVILDDRKHGRAGKFPVFYDIDTGDYLEPPEGFLESHHETLREWYTAYPHDDPSSPEYATPAGTAAQELSPENQDMTGSDLTEGDIPPADAEFLAAQAEAEASFLAELGQDDGSEDEDDQQDDDSVVEQTAKTTEVVNVVKENVEPPKEDSPPELPEVVFEDDGFDDDQCPF